MIESRRRLGPVLTAAVLVAMATACPKRTAPAPSSGGGPNDETEARLGQVADRKLLEEVEPYSEKPDLTAYVASVGGRVAGLSERSALGWHFVVLDAPEANSFSLPGGYVYVTRGLLARLNTEDELAAALAHDIAHIVFRHAMAEISKAPGAPLSTAGPELFTDPDKTVQLGKVVDLALKLARQGFSPEKERQADEVGAVYTTAAGYNPRGDLYVYRALQILRDEDPGRAEPWYTSHPLAEERTVNLKTEITELKESRTRDLLRPLRREDYLRQIDGLSLGSGTRAGYVSGSRYVSTRELLTLEIPRGWSARPGSGERVLVMARANAGYVSDLRVQAMLTPGTASDAARRYASAFSRENLEPLGPLTQATLPAGEGAVASLRGRDPQGRPLLVRAVFLTRFDKLLILTMTVPEAEGAETQQAFMDLAGSIKYLHPDEARAPSDPKVALRRTKQGDTWESLAGSELGSSDEAQRIASFNGMTPNKPPPVGTLLKLPSRPVAAGGE